MASGRSRRMSTACVGESETHVIGMQVLSEAELLGFVELKVGSLAVQVPIRANKSETNGPTATFIAEDGSCAILVRGDTTSAVVEEAVREAAHDAERHLSRKLLN